MKYIISTLLLLLAIQANAQPMCGTLEQAAAVMKQYDEKIVFTGDRSSPSGQPAPDKSKIIISLNKKTGTWSAFIFITSDRVCVLESGENGK